MAVWFCDLEGDARRGRAARVHLTNHAYVFLSLPG